MSQTRPKRAVCVREREREGGRGREREVMNLNAATSEIDIHLLQLLAEGPSDLVPLQWFSTTAHTNIHTPIYRFIH